MSNNDANLKDLLWLIRQHPGMNAFLAEIAPPPLRRFRPGREGKDATPEQIAMKNAHASGMLDQHDRIVAIIRGSQPDSNSIQESIEE